MYALIHKDKVLSGPKDWNRNFWTTVLKRKGIEGVILPRNPVDDLPFVAEQDVKISKVEVVQPPLNNLVEYHQGPTWDLTGDVAVANYEVVDLPIDEARGRLKDQAKQERRRKELEPLSLTVQDTEVSVATDRDERSVFVSKLSAMSDGETVNWKFDDAWLTLSKSDLQTVISAIDAHVQSAFDWEKDIHDQLDVASSKEELLAIQIVQPRLDGSEARLLTQVYSQNTENPTQEGRDQFVEQMMPVLQEFRDSNPDATQEEVIAHIEQNLA